MRSLVVACAAAALVAACAGPTRTPAPTPVSDPPPTRPPSPSATLPPSTSTPTSTASPGATGSATASPTDPSGPPTEIGLELFADGFGPLTLLAAAPGQAGVVFVVEQEGRVWQLGVNGAAVPEPYLDLTDRVSYDGELGLLGLAFHPDFAENGRLFVNYTDLEGNTVISELAAEPGCACADPASERVLLTFEQPYPNHNGGMLAFGHDGYLYVSSGDGGGAGDPLDAGQDLTTLLGKILRIDVDAPDAETPYSIPRDNPFADGASGAQPEIWAFGLRNPWRMSFDRQTGALFIGDVGQGMWEEINVEPAGRGGRNYGWNTMEGTTCFDPPQGCDRAGLTLPVASYRTRNGCAVTGGYVYRGSAVPGLSGTYLFADYCSGDVYGIDSARALAGEPQQPVLLAESGRNVTSFGEDNDGELYLVTAGGEVLRVGAP